MKLETYQSRDGFNYHFYADPSFHPYLYREGHTVNGVCLTFGVFNRAEAKEARTHAENLKASRDVVGVEIVMLKQK